jgi:hypothetical protein
LFPGGALFPGGVNFELDYGTATALGNPPHSFKAEKVTSGNQVFARLTWKAANLQNTGTVQYQVYRVEAPLNATTFSKKKLVGQTTQLTIDDKQGVGANNISTFIWFATAQYDDGSGSRMSNTAKIP